MCQLSSQALGMQPRTRRTGPRELTLVGGSFSLSLSLSVSHTHTHTHTPSINESGGPCASQRQAGCLACLMMPSPCCRHWAQVSSSPWPPRAGGAPAYRPLCTLHCSSQKTQVAEPGSSGSSGPTSTSPLHGTQKAVQGAVVRWCLWGM